MAAGAEPPSRLLLLPDECLSRVLSELDPRTLLLLLPVCQKLRTAARSEDLWAVQLARLWATNPKPYARNYGLRPWLRCVVSVASLDGKGTTAVRIMPWRCAETPHCRIEAELSWRQSFQASCGYLAVASNKHDRMGWVFPGDYEICDADLIDHEWEVDFLPNPQLPTTPRVAAAVFHPDGCFEDSFGFARLSRFCEWGLKRCKHDGDGPGEPGTPFPGERGPLNMTLCAPGLTDRHVKHGVRRARDSPASWEITGSQIYATIRSTGRRHERVTGCRATGLVSRLELNGRECTVLSFHVQKGRYVVQFVDSSARPPAAPRLASRDDPRSQVIIHSGEKMALKPQNVLLPPMAAVKICGLTDDGDPCMRALGTALNGRHGRIAPTARFGELEPASCQQPLPIGAPPWEAAGGAPQTLAVRLLDFADTDTDDVRAETVQVPLGKCLLHLVY